MKLRLIYVYGYRSEINTVEGMFQVEKWLHKVIKLLTGVIGTPF
jgi:hypothetical protein